MITSIGADAGLDDGINLEGRDIFPARIPRKRKKVIDVKCVHASRDESFDTHIFAPLVLGIAGLEKSSLIDTRIVLLMKLYFCPMETVCVTDHFENFTLHLVEINNA